MAKFALYVLPADYWAADSDENPIAPLLREAVNLRRRVAKGANLEAERSRYGTCLSDLEQRLTLSAALTGPVDISAATAAAREGRLAGFDLPPHYFDLVVMAHLDRVERLGVMDATTGVVSGAEPGASVFPPALLSARAEELEKLAAGTALSTIPALQELARQLAAVSRSVGKAGGGIVEVSEELDNQDLDGLAPPPERSRPERKVSASALRAADEARTLTSKGRKRMAERFSRLVEAALPGNDLVNLSDQPHEVSTEVLSQFLYGSEGKPAGQVRVQYADGSEARPFPLRALAAPTLATSPRSDRLGDGVIELAVALMSMRHLELDPFVDRAWYRNKEVSVTRPLADSDEFCYQFSLKELAELRDVYAGQKVLIRMFHTGFEPAAVGFYRAVAAELKARRGWLRVLPHYFRGGTRFETGQVVWE